METLLLARAKYLLDRVSNNVKYPTLDGSPALPAEAAELIECLGKLELVEAAAAMRKDFIVYFAHEARLPNTGLDPRLVEFRSKANELFGPFLRYSRPEGDSTVVRLRLIDQFDGLRITFKKLSTLSSPLTPPKQPTKPKGKPGPGGRFTTKEQAIISALLQHHHYDSPQGDEFSNIGSTEAASYRELCRLSGVKSTGTIRSFFHKWFPNGGNAEYKRICRSGDAKKLGLELARLVPGDAPEFSSLYIDKEA